jgi:hypothetical protein
MKSVVDVMILSGRIWSKSGETKLENATPSHPWITRNQRVISPGCNKFSGTWQLEVQKSEPKIRNRDSRLTRPTTIRNPSAGDVFPLFRTISPGSPGAG